MPIVHISMRAGKPPAYRQAIFDSFHRAMLPTRCREPAEFFFGKKFPVAAPGMQTHDHRVEFPPVKLLEQVTRRTDPDFDQQLRVLRVHARDQRGQLRPRNMLTDSDGETLPGAGKCRKRAIVHPQQFAGVFEEDRTPRRHFHAPGRALDKPPAEPVFEPLELQAHPGLRRLQDFSRAREAAEVGNENKSLDRIQIKGALNHFK